MNTGRALERDVRALGVELYNEQIAFIFKCPEEMQQTPCDFFGFTKSGRAILIECKTVNRSSLPLGSSNGLQPHQIRALQQAHDCCAISLLVWRRGDKTMTVSWDEVQHIAYGRKSIPWFDHRTDWRQAIRSACSLA